jgi:hypothetical protein
VTDVMAYDAPSPTEYQRAIAARRQGGDAAIPHPALCPSRNGGSIALHSEGGVPVEQPSERWIPIDELPVIQEGRVSRWTINDWARKGKFGEDMSKPGRVRWFRHDAFERLMAREAQQPKGA